MVEFIKEKKVIKKPMTACNSCLKMIMLCPNYYIQYSLWDHIHDYVLFLKARRKIMCSDNFKLYRKLTIGRYDVSNLKAYHNNCS